MSREQMPIQKAPALVSSKPTSKKVWGSSPCGAIGFYNALLDLIVMEVLSKSEPGELSEEKVREYLLRPSGIERYSEDEYTDLFRDERSELSSIFCVENVIDDNDIVLENISFPYSSKGDKYDYVPLLDKLKEVRFLRCRFYTEKLEFQEAAVRFEECGFLLDWVACLSSMGSECDALYKNCNFKARLEIDGRFLECFALESCQSILDGCDIQELVVRGLLLESNLFRERSGEKNRVVKLSIVSSKIKSKFCINNLDIESVFIKDTNFSNKFEMKGCRVNSFCSENTNFKKTADFHGSFFGHLFVKRAVFDDFLAMENCRFGSDAIVSGAGHVAGARFAYVTFYGFISFRDSVFYRKLDLREINYKVPPNFLGCLFEKPAIKETDRETFKIVKKSFDAVGNNVDANRFYSKEMQAYHRELKGAGNRSERFLLWCNGWMSNYGQSYIRPVVLIVVCMLALYLIRIGYENNFLYKIYSPANDALSWGARVLNGFAESLVVFKALMLEGMEFISLLFGIIFSILIWQAVAAIKRHSIR